ISGVRWLLEHGANPNVTSSERDETPLHQIARHGGSRAMAELLLEHGANSNAPRADGRTPYELALRGANQPLGELLRRAGAADEAPVNVRDREFGSSPLGWAAHGSRHFRDADSDYEQVIQALLEAGADRASSINRWNAPPESLASPAIAELLKARR